MSLSKWLPRGQFKAVYIAVSTLIVAFASMAGIVVSPSALAASHTLYVGHGTVGDGSSCSSPGFTSVQAAVDAAAKNDTVYLCGGQFAEQVFIDKSLTLTGDTTSGLTAVGTSYSTHAADYPSAFTTDNLFLPQALLVIEGPKTKAQVNYLTISGPMAGNGGCVEQEFGVLALEGDLTMNSDQVTNIADTSSALYGCQFGVGIQVGRTYWPVSDFSSNATPNFSATATLNYVTVSGYQKNGITVDGSGSKGTINGAVVTGGGSAAPFGNIIAQNGVQLSRGATGVIEDSTISNNAYSGAGGAASGGVLLYGGAGDPLVIGATVKDNTLTNNDVGVYVAEYNDAGSNAASTPTHNQVFDNMLSNSAVTNVSGLCASTASCNVAPVGYQAGVSDVGNNDQVHDNMITGAGYQTQGTFDYKVTPNVYTQTGANMAFVRPVDTGASFYDTNPKTHDNMFY